MKSLKIRLTFILALLITAGLLTHPQLQGMQVGGQAQEAQEEQGEKGGKRDLDTQEDLKGLFDPATFNELEEIEQVHENDEQVRLNHSQDMEQHIQHWIHQLSSEERFEEFKEASWESHPLGPGTHGWIVIIHNHNKEVGYLVISSSPEGHLHLTEYGVGPHPLFSLNTLHQTLVQHELIYHHLSYERFYFNPFQAIWRVSTDEKLYYFDAVTGEAYPLTKTHLDKLKKTSENPLYLTSKSSKSSPSPTPSIDKTLQGVSLALFDPFEQINWITNEPLSIQEMSEFVNKLSPDVKITYTALMYDNLILNPLAVIGYHSWVKLHPASYEDSEPEHYIAFDQWGTRYIPFPIVIQNGHFYPQK